MPPASRLRSWVLGSTLQAPPPVSGGGYSPCMGSAVETPGPVLALARGAQYTFAYTLTSGILVRADHRTTPPRPRLSGALPTRPARKSRRSRLAVRPLSALLSFGQRIRPRKIDLQSVMSESFSPRAALSAAAGIATVATFAAGSLSAIVTQTSPRVVIGFGVMGYVTLVWAGVAGVWCALLALGIRASWMQSLPSDAEPMQLPPPDTPAKGLRRLVRWYIEHEWAHRPLFAVGSIAFFGGAVSLYFRFASHDLAKWDDAQSYGLALLGLLIWLAAVGYRGYLHEKWSHCPECASKVLRRARRCRYCRALLPRESPSSN